MWVSARATWYVRASRRATRRPHASQRADASPYSQPATLWAVGVVRRVIGAEPAAHVTS